MTELDESLKKTILIVDDDEALRDILKMMLEYLGYDIVTALDGLDCLEMYEKHRAKIELVLLDMTMPSMDGEEAFIELHKINPDIKVIITTGCKEEVVKEKFKEFPISGFVHKPFKMEFLDEQISALLG
ncbi:MAG: response regulator [Mariprofundaceae bacterium]|nr:response regulator [Mariprofundaceae bacterium]